MGRFPSAAWHIVGRSDCNGICGEIGTQGARISRSRIILKLSNTKDVDYGLLCDHGKTFIAV